MNSYTLDKNLENKRHSVFTTNSNINNAFLSLSISDKKKNNLENSKKVKLRSNSIFAFQNNDIYSNLATDEVKSVLDSKQFSDFSGENTSNFFSNYGDKHSYANKFLKLVENKKLNESFCTISSDMEKNLDSVVEEENGERNEDNMDFIIKKERKSNKFDNDLHQRSFSASSGKSEKYDEVEEFSNEKSDFKDKGLKRMSLESEGMTHYTSNPHFDIIIKKKLNNLGNAINYENENNKSALSYDFTASQQSFSSPIISASPIKNRSNRNSFLITPQVNINNMNFHNIGAPLNNSFNNCGNAMNMPITNYSSNSIYNNAQLQNFNNYALNMNGQTFQNEFMQNPISLLNYNKLIPGAFSLNTSINFNQKNFNNSMQNISNKPNNLNNSNNVNISSNNNPNLLNMNMIKNLQKNQNFTLSSFNNSPNNQSFQSNTSNSSSKNIFKPNHTKNSKSYNSINNFIVNFPNYLQDEKYVIENILILLKDQNGCRMVQQKLKEKAEDPYYISTFYQKIQNDIIEIINDQFGNYVVQKYIEIIQNDKDLITNFFERIRCNLFEISVHHYGTRFFQRALEYLTVIYPNIETNKLNEILRELIENHILDLILDTNGNHVFQKILILYPKNKNQFIYDLLCKIAYDVSKLKQGGCIFGRAFECGSADQRKQLVLEILSYFGELINDEYGNFIIQQIVFLKNGEFNDIVFRNLKDNICVLSKKKFSSNVIDKCILMEDPSNKNKLRNDIINLLIENKLVAELICDQYGNYVIQKALQVTDGLKFMAIIHEIKSAIKILKQTSHGRKTYENLIMQYGDYFQQNNTKYNINDGRRISQLITYPIQNKLEK